MYVINFFKIVGVWQIESDFTEKRIKVYTSMEVQFVQLFSKFVLFPQKPQTEKSLYVQNGLL